MDVKGAEIRIVWTVGPNQELLMAASETIKECIILASSNWSRQMASMD